MAEEKKVAETKAGQYRANQRGYADGQLIEEGEAVPAGVPVSDVWMDKVSTKEDRMAERTAEVQAEFIEDPALESLPTAALKKRAMEAGVTDVKGLKDDELIRLINAERDRTRTQ